MNATAATATEGLEELDAEALMVTGTGIPFAPVVWGVGIYLAKTVGDHWGDFKEGIGEGFTAVWGER